MKKPKGFGKAYFSLAAILAFSSSAMMASQNQSYTDSSDNATVRQMIDDSGDAVNEDDPIVISKKIEVKEVDAPFASEIYTQKDIKNSHAKDLYDFLNSQTSVTTLPSYGNSFSQLIDMGGYGLESGYENVVITVNGRRLNNIDMTPQLLSNIPLESIKKIEIIKGSGSVEYGDGANAGVINIITKDFDGVSLSTYVGTHGLWHADANIGIKQEKFAVSGFINNTGSDGDRVIASDGTRDDGYSKNKGFKLTLTPCDKLSVFVGKTFSTIDTKYANSLTLSQYEEDPKTVPDPSWGAPYSEQYYKDDVLSYGMDYDFDGKLSFVFRGSNEDKSSNYITYNLSNKYDYDSYNGSLYYKTENAKLVLGLQKFNGKRVNQNTMEKDDLGYFLKGNFFIGKSTISLGARRERVEYDYSNARSSLSDDMYLNAYDFGYNYKLTNNSSLFVNINRSFEAPDVDRFFSYDFANNSYTFNGFIKPAKVNNYNLGYNYFKYPHRFKFSAFYANVKDEIYYNAATWQNTNLNKTRKYGFTLQEKYNIHYNLFVKLNYSFVDTKIKENSSDPSIEGNEIPGVSKHNLKVSIGYNPTYKLSLLLSHTYRSKAYAMSDFDESYGKMDSYNSTDFSIGYKLKKLNLFAKVNNIFDKKNALFVDSGYALGVYPVNYERTFMFGVSVKF
ncbi:MAG: TonB-dependent receptor [Epsilonproteobacteria bacterium]|nr:TonB-dependent receptor [Campylobacterota bacterium]